MSPLDQLFLQKRDHHHISLCFLFFMTTNSIQTISLVQIVLVVRNDHLKLAFEIIRITNYQLLLTLNTLGNQKVGGSFFIQSSQNIITILPFFITLFIVLIIQLVHFQTYFLFVRLNIQLGIQFQHL